jgi:GTP cyclohydrolase II
MLVATGSEPLATRHGDFVVHRFHNCTTGEPALAVTCGDVTTPEDLPARIHSSCITSEALGARDCDCAEQLDAALAHVARRGRGALFYLMQEGRGAGFVAKALDRMLVQASGGRLSTFEAYARLGLPADQRSYGEVTAMTRLLGVRAPLRVLSNNPDKLAALRAAGTMVAGIEPLQIRTSAYTQHYLDAKSRAGHTVASTIGIDPAVLPEPVVVVEAEPLVTAPHLVRVARYLLPVRTAEAAWLRLHVYVDAATGRDRVVLTHGHGGADVLVRLQRERMLDRFPVLAPTLRPRWDETVARIVAHGRGIVLFAGDADDVDDVAAPLVRAHLDGRRGVVLALDADERDDVALLGRVLEGA